MTAKILYKSSLRCEATHLLSGTTIQTDAPIDNNGKGEFFSPTDLVATALGACIMTIMGMAAQTHAIVIDGSTCDIEKIMNAHPRRIKTIKINIQLKGQAEYSEKQIQILEKAALGCPVWLSLNENVEKVLIINH